jgi:DNA-binding NtrC family response regulator
MIGVKVSEERYLLLVDDMRVICELLADALTAEGFTVRTSMNGKQALEAIRLRTPALIIIDQVMPGKDGLQTLREAQELIEGVPVIMISGYTEEKQEIVEAKRQGLIRHFISKPFDMRYLVRLVKETLSPLSGPGGRKI